LARRGDGLKWHRRKEVGAQVRVEEWRSLGIFLAVKLGDWQLTPQRVGY